MLTNFPNGITSFGIPVFGSFGGTPISIPSGQTGNILMADPTGRASALTGLAFTTLQAALNAAADGAGDTIFVFPGSYEENLTVTKDYVTLIGAQQAGYARPDIVPTTGKALNVTGQGFQCINMRFASADADTVTQSGNGFTYSNCVFDGDAGQAADEACFRLVGADDDSHTASEGIIQGSLFRGASVGAGLIIQHAPAAAGGTGCTDNQIIGNRFYGNGVDILSAVNTTGGGAGIYLNHLFAGNVFMTVGAAYVYINMAAGVAADLLANSGLFTGNTFADEALVAAQVVLTGQSKVIFAGNYDAAGVVDGSGFN